MSNLPETIHGPPIVLVISLVHFNSLSRFTCYRFAIKGVKFAVLFSIPKSTNNVLGVSVIVVHVDQKILKSWCTVNSEVFGVSKFYTFDRKKAYLQKDLLKFHMENIGAFHSYTK